VPAPPPSPCAPPFPDRYSAAPVAGDPSRFFLHPYRSGYWVVSPQRGRWVLYGLASKQPIGWEDVTEPKLVRKVRDLR
jgi:hypothetical protein